MQTRDWIVLVVTLAFIVLYGVYKTRGRKNVQDYIRGGNESKWYGMWNKIDVPKTFEFLKY